MPDANGNIKGTGWSRARAAGWERAFGPVELLTTDAVRQRYHDAMPGCPWGYESGCPISDCRANNDNATPSA